MSRGTRTAAGQRFQLEVDLDHEAGRTPQRLHPDVETPIYRMAQEALRNALKHADAQTVAIAVAEIEDEVGVRVRDDGQGYDANALTSGFGLVSIRERVGTPRRPPAGHFGSSEEPPSEARVPARHLEPAPAAPGG